MVYIILRRMTQAFILLLVTLIIVIAVSCFKPKEIELAEGIETDRLVYIDEDHIPELDDVPVSEAIFEAKWQELWSDEYILIGYRDAVFFTKRNLRGLLAYEIKELRWEIIERKNGLENKKMHGMMSKEQFIIKLNLYESR